MTKNEKLAEISTNAFSLLCTIADEYRGKYKPIYGEKANQKWWLVLYPAVHIPTDREFNIGVVSGLSFPTTDISIFVVNMGSRFCFPTQEITMKFGNATKDLWKDFLYPELSL
jgi:hypothetical protein